VARGIAARKAFAMFNLRSTKLMQIIGNFVIGE